MENTKKVGNLTELQCATRLYELGCAVSIPFGNSEKYDLIIDWNNKLYKVQVKTTKSIKNNIMSFATKTTNYTKGKWKSKSYKIDDVDFFFLYCMENDWCGLYVPKGKINTDITIRLEKPKNNQKKGIHLADDYSFEKQILLLLNEN